MRPFLCFLRILNIHTKLYGENDGRVGMAMIALARAKLALGKTISLSLKFS